MPSKSFWKGFWQGMAIYPPIVQWWRGRKPPEPTDSDLLGFGYAPGEDDARCIFCDGWMYDVAEQCHVCRSCAVVNFKKFRRTFPTGTEPK